MQDDDQRTDEPPAEEAFDDSIFPYGGSPYGFGWSAWPWSDVEDENDAYGESDEFRPSEATDEGGRLGEGVVSVLLVVGVVLFLFPEPATSAIGMGLVALGLAMWLLDWLP
ncbi:hypothetical protein [Halomicrococcus sp. NG-SE-24]|uniref:hypothetical protein n=1 Tax=Halomicrococcus sp. NG-SE-24 TaxID=3436928 RepID=UPI003D97D639